MTPGHSCLGTNDPLGHKLLRTRDRPLEKMTPLKCTVAVKGMTVFRHTKKVQKGLGESAQRNMQVKNQKQFYVVTVYTNKSLGLVCLIPAHL